MLSVYYIKGEIGMTHLLLAIIYLAFISLGLPDSLLGSAWAVYVPGISAFPYLTPGSYP